MIGARRPGRPGGALVAARLRQLGHQRGDELVAIPGPFERPLLRRHGLEPVGGARTPRPTGSSDFSRRHRNGSYDRC